MLGPQKMTNKKKIQITIIVVIMTLAFGGLLLSEGRRIIFSLECMAAEAQLEKNFEAKKVEFFELANLVEHTPPLEFDLYSVDTINMRFHPPSIYSPDLFIDSIYFIGPAEKSGFLVNENNCLEIVDTDTMEVCNHNWLVHFHGHYKDNRIDNLLSYYGWPRMSFEKLVEKVQALNCMGFSNGNMGFELRYKVVSYYNDEIIHCFGHSDGYFDYLYTAQPDSFYWQSSLKQLEDNFYGIEHWNF